MKIRIEFERGENEILNKVSETDVNFDDIATQINGKFGSFKFQNKVFEADIKTKFIESYAKLIYNIFATFKSVFYTFESFIEKWFDDEDIEVIDLNEQKAQEENDKKSDAEETDQITENVKTL